jgi:hypothetical protein
MKSTRLVVFVCAVAICGLAAWGSFAGTDGPPAPPAKPSVDQPAAATTAAGAATVARSIPPYRTAPAASFSPDMTPMTACQGVVCEFDCDCQVCCEDGGYTLYHCGEVQHHCICA